jgi:hypothetical protein
MHKQLAGVVFNIEATTFYGAIAELQIILGPERHWINNYLCIKQGKVINYKCA